jgi:hypothetical protein
MQQKSDGRVVRLLTKHVSAEDQALEQWFLIAIGDDDKATDAIAIGDDDKATEKPLTRWQSQRMRRMQFLRSLDTSLPPLSPAGG